MIVIPAVELRGRRELFSQVLTRLSSGQPWSRVDLFASKSAQAAKVNWQRQALQQLVKLEWVVRVGTPKAPRYRAADKNAACELLQMASEPKMIDAILRESMERAPKTVDAESVDADAAEAPAEGTPEMPPTEITPPGETLDGPLAGHILQYVSLDGPLAGHILQYVYMIAQAVIDIRERLPRLESRLDALTKLISGTSMALHVEPNASAQQARRRPAEVRPASMVLDGLLDEPDEPEDEDDDVRPREKAVAFLITALAAAGGSAPVNEIEAKAIAAGISKRTLRRAMHDANVLVGRHGNKFVWSLPLTTDQEAAQETLRAAQQAAAVEVHTAMVAAVVRSRLSRQELAALASPVRDAVLFLEAVLEEQPLPASLVIQNAQEETISPPALQKACLALNIVVTKRSFGSEWALPAHQTT